MSSAIFARLQQVRRERARQQATPDRRRHQPPPLLDHGNLAMVVSVACPQVVPEHEVVAIGCGPGEAASNRRPARVVLWYRKTLRPGGSAARPAAASKRRQGRWAGSGVDSTKTCPCRPTRRRTRCAAVAEAAGQTLQASPHRGRLEGESEVLRRLRQPPEVAFQEEVAVLALVEHRFQQFKLRGEVGGQHGGLRLAFGILARLVRVPDDAAAHAVFRPRRPRGRWPPCEWPR